MISLIVRNVGGNILLLMPLGFLVPLIWNKAKDFKKVTLIGSAVSIAIELLQLIESLGGGWDRVTDIDDVICNVAGTIIGYLIYVLITKSGVKYIMRFNNNLSK